MTSVRFQRTLRRAACLALAVACCVPIDLAACSRAVYLGEEGLVITGRTMDWVEDLHSNLWVFPQGMKRSGAAGENSLEWASLHGSVVVSGYEAASTDGMNERGLVMNLLYLVESEYPAAGDDRPAMSIAAWGQYVLDRFATVAEAVDALGREEFRVVGPTLPNGMAGNGHVSLSDATGDSAVFEYVGGKLVIHHGREHQVMTNSPTFEKQLALNEYWKQIGGTTMLPGTNRAADRFARASFYIGACTRTAEPREGVASVFSVMRNVSVPRGITTPGQPNISTTIWRTVANQKSMVYYYEGTYSPSATWIKLADLDFSPGSGVRKLQLDGNPDLAGNVTDEFKPAEPYEFLNAE
ncbi:MAG: linear amide C-N hydrolase [Lacipirellulaceae bacterium]